MNVLKSTEFKVGISVMLATVILVMGIIWGKGYKIEPNKQQLQVTFDNVGGMMPGDPVTVNGVKEGTVLTVVSKERRALCELEISDTIQLYEDASFTIVSAELLAGMRVEISPGKAMKKINMALQPFHGIYGGRIVDVGLTIGQLSENMSALTFHLDTTVTLINRFLSGGKFQKELLATIQNTNAVSRKFDLMLQKNEPGIALAIKDLQKGAHTFNGLLDSNKTNISASLANLKSVSARLDTVTGSLNSLLVKLQDKKGSVGRMMNDSTFYKNINSTLSRLDSLAKKIKDEGLDIDLF